MIPHEICFKGQQSHQNSDFQRLNIGTNQVQSNSEEVFDMQTYKIRGTRIFTQWFSCAHNFGAFLLTKSMNFLSVTQHQKSWHLGPSKRAGDNPKLMLCHLSQQLALSYSFSYSECVSFLLKTFSYLDLFTFCWNFYSNFFVTFHVMM